MNDKCSARISRALALSVLAVAVACPGDVAATAAVSAVGRASRGILNKTSPKTAQLASLTARDLHGGLRSDNVRWLLDVASVRGRVDELGQIRAWSTYSAIDRGDALLLVCLQHRSCDLDVFARNVKLGGLHREVAIRQPALGSVQVGHAVGAVSEAVMVRHFEVSGWTQIEGQIGRAGIDGLFIKRKADGTLGEVLFVESKYNTSQPQMTNHGMQMSQDWLLKKVRDLQGAHPENPVYVEIEQRILAGHYRSRLWGMRVDDDSIRINLDRIHSKDGDITVVDDIEQRIPPPSQVISIRNPQSGRDRLIVQTLQSELDKVGRSPPLR